MAKVAFIGLGNMGSPMAANLVKTGHDVVVFDLVSELMRQLSEQGANTAASALAATEEAEFVITMLPAGQHVEKVYLGDNGLLSSIEGSPHHVLAQVAFSALIDCNQFKLRSKFNRKVTDFVLLDKQLEVIAIIELDDPSHLGKEHIDAQRDEMLEQAGYQVYRYTDIPSCRDLRKDIAN